jgi:hypothetical protein
MHALNLDSKGYRSLKYEYFIYYCIIIADEQYLMLQDLVACQELQAWYYCQWREQVETQLNEWCVPYMWAQVDLSVELHQLIAEKAAPINLNYPSAILKIIDL